MGSIRIGDSPTGPVVLNAHARETHLHVIGATGSGKSKFLEHMVREDIKRGHGVCFIDPHGATYNDLIDWLDESGLANRRQVHLIDPCSPDYAVGFNPLAGEETAALARVDSMVRACAKVWGGDFNSTPRLQRMLRNVFYALAENNLSILESDALTGLAKENARRKLTTDLDNAVFRGEWRELNDNYANPQNANMFVEVMDSVRTRLLPFIASPAIRAIMGQTKGVIDFKRCMDEQHIVLVNLGNSAHASAEPLLEEDGRLLGAMLFSELFRSAKGRNEASAKAKPFYCYVDECADYLTDDIARMLDQTRKFGLHLILAHQRIRQLGEPDSDLFNGVMESARSKVVFNLVGEETAENFARHLFRGSFDLNRRKEGLTNPVAVGQEIITLTGKSKTIGETHSYGSASSYGQSSTESQTAGESQFIPIDGEIIGATQSENLSMAAGESSSSSTSESHSLIETESTTESETLATVYEERGVPMALEEQIHEAVAMLRTLPDRHAFFLGRGDHVPTIFKTRDVRPVRVFPGFKERYIERQAHRSVYTHDRVEVRGAIAHRQDNPSAVRKFQVDLIDDGDDFFDD